MMPSRGLRTAHGRLTIRIQPSAQCRHLSSSPRSHLRCASHIKPSILRTSQPWTTSIPAVVFPLSSLRYASTAQSANTHAAATTSTTPPPESAVNPNLDTITLDNLDLNASASDVDISSIPEGIGYLQQIGLDYGWGPTSMIQWVLEHFHIYAGLPWWASIAATAVAIRVVTFPLYLKASDMQARQAALVSVTKPFYDKMKQAQAAGDTQALMLAHQQIGAVRKRAGITYRDQLLPMAVQAVMGFCGFRLMRKCAELPVPGFVDGGFLWLQDLTMTDGYLLMPVLMAASMHVIIRLGGESGGGPNQMPGGMQKFMLYGMPSLIALLMSWQPGAVCVWFAGSGSVGMAQALLLQRPAVRRFFNLAPIYKPKPGEGPAHLLAAMTGADQQQQAGRPTSAPSNADPFGKNTAYMRPTYQSPKINRRDSGRVIDTTLIAPQASGKSAPTSEMVQPGKAAESTPKKGVISGFKERVMENYEKYTTQTPEQKKKAERAAFKKRAERYEQAAQKRAGKVGR